MYIFIYTHIHRICILHVIYNSRSPSTGQRGVPNPPRLSLVDPITRYWSRAPRGGMAAFRGDGWMSLQLMISWWFISIRPPCIQLFGWRFAMGKTCFFGIFTPILTWENDPSWRIFFRWVGSTTSDDQLMIFDLTPSKFNSKRPWKVTGPQKDRTVFQASFFSEKC